MTYGKPPTQLICSKCHDRRANAQLDPPRCHRCYTAERKAADARLCRIDQCDRRFYARELCLRHYRRLMLFGDPLGQGPGRGRRPIPEPGYGAVHKRLRKHRGRAALYACVDCGEPARQWAYDYTATDERHATVRGSIVAYSFDLNDYSPRCTACHGSFDAAHLSRRKALQP
jgi:hypothetical protein